MSTAVAFMAIGFVLGALCVWGLTAAEARPPRPLPRSRPRASVSNPAGAASSHPSNVRRVPRWEQDYAAEFLDDCRKYGQNEATRRRTGR